MIFPQVSIIIPAKNEEENIGLCLDALQKTGYPHEKIEIIVIDNGSSDQTVSIVKTYNVKLLEIRDVNVSGLRNAGAKKASSDILIFIDADVLVTRDWLKAGVTAMMNEPEICCLGGYIDIPPQSTWIEKAWHLRLETSAERIYTDWVSSMNMFVKKDVFMTAGGFNEKLITGEDVDLCFRMKNLGRILFLRNAEVIHLGEAKTLKHFFLKERWRGQSNLNGILSHGLHFRELPSIVLPLFYLYFYLIFLPLLIVTQNVCVILFHVGLFLLIPVTRGFMVCFGRKQFSSFFSLAFLWWLYYTARAFALLTVTKRRN